MTNKKIIKNFKKVSIIILIAVFSITGLVACFGSDDIMGSRRRNRGGNFTEISDTGDTGITDSDIEKEISEPEANPNKEKSYPEETYYNIYIPFWGWTNVSYKDTNTLNTLYRQFIESGRGGKNNPNQSRWFIRNGDNYLDNPMNGNYYYFDKDLNIRHAGSYMHKRLLKKFLGAVIIDYSQNSGEGGWGNGSGPGLLKGRWSIGGLYETAMMRTSDPEYGKGYFDYDGYDKGHLHIFMGSEDYRQRGHVEIILMNEGYSDGKYVEFGLDIYYCSVSGEGDIAHYKYSKYKNYYLGADPKTYTSSSVLNVRTNLSWLWGKANGQNYMGFKFFSYAPSAWHLE